MKTMALQIRIDLKDASPPIWRRILVPADTTLAQLHFYLQGAFGWTDSHLHGFRQGERRFCNDQDSLSGMEPEDSVSIGELLRTVQSTLTYDYDFGDDWEHVLRLEKRVELTQEDYAALPRLLAGRRACPPEDCGGIYGYQRFLERLRTKDPDALEWAEEAGMAPGWTPDAFNLEEHQADMRALAQQNSGTTLAWSALEEQLAWATVESFLLQPQWRDSLEAAKEVMSVSDAALTAANDSVADRVSGFRGLIRDHAAFDMILEHDKPFIPELIRAHPALPEGAQRFLMAMFHEPMAPYLTEAADKDGVLLLFSLVEKKLVEVEALPGWESIGDGELLFARVISNGKNQVLRGEFLHGPFAEEEYQHLMHHLQQACLHQGGEPEDRVQLLKPAAPLFFAFWAMIQDAGEMPQFPLATFRGAPWEPGSSLLVGTEDLADGCMAAFTSSSVFHQVDPAIWMLADPDRDPEDASYLSLPAIPVAWLLCSPGQLCLLAGSRQAMKYCRTQLKKLNLPYYRHHRTSFSPDLELSVVPLNEMPT